MLFGRAGRASSHLSSNILVSNSSSKSYSSNGSNNSTTSNSNHTNNTSTSNNGSKRGLRFSDFFCKTSHGMIPPSHDFSAERLIT